MTRTEQLITIGRIREFVSDVRQGKQSIFSATDILTDIKRLEDEISTTTPNAGFQCPCGSRKREHQCWS